MPGLGPAGTSGQSPGQAPSRFLLSALHWPGTSWEKKVGALLRILCPTNFFFSFHESPVSAPGGFQSMGSIFVFLKGRRLMDPLSRRQLCWARICHSFSDLHQRWMQFEPRPQEPHLYIYMCVYVLGGWGGAEDIKRKPASLFLTSPVLYREMPSFEKCLRLVCACAITNVEQLV